jgi:hypothetical protein
MDFYKSIRRLLTQFHHETAFEYDEFDYIS